MHSSRFGSSLSALLFVLILGAGLRGLGAEPAQLSALPSVVDLVGASVAAELASGAKATRTDTEDRLLLVPKTRSAEDLRRAVEASKPSLLVETVFVLSRAAPADAAGIEAERARIYGLMRSFSSLEGIEYFSQSRGRMRTLYAESWIVSDETRREKLPDPLPPAPGALPAAESFTVWQKDLSFGGNLYAYGLRSLPEGLEVTSTNLTRMSYGIVPMIGPRGLVSRLLVLQGSDGILFYVESDANAPGIFQGKIGDSFSNRAAALFDWFSRRFPRR